MTQSSFPVIYKQIDVIEDVDTAMKPIGYYFNKTDSNTALFVLLHYKFRSLDCPQV
jgi:hypothetical protein